jgi:hypothetical protein
MTAPLAPAFGALFFASPDACAKNTVAKTNETANARIVLVLIEALLMLRKP